MAIPGEGDFRISMQAAAENSDDLQRKERKRHLRTFRREQISRKSVF
jgi:hypothetical protein